MSTRQQVATAALAWLGTPYHHHGRVRGVGVDCAMLLAEVYAGAGLVAPVEPGHYPHDWHLNRSEELFLAWLDRVGAREVQTPALADAGVWRFGRTYSHGGVVVAVEPVVIAHAHQKGGSVVCTGLDEYPFDNRPVRWFTLFDDAQ